MKFILLLVSTIFVFSAEAKVKSFSFKDDVKVKKVTMKNILPTGFSKLHRDFYFQDRMIAKK